MVELLGPAMARTLVGDNYDPDCIYQLVTDEHGMSVVVSNEATGQYDCIFLDDDGNPDVTERPAPMWERYKGETVETQHRFSPILVGGIACLLAACLIFYWQIH